MSAFIGHAGKTFCYECGRPIEEGQAIELRGRATAGRHMMAPTVAAGELWTVPHTEQWTVSHVDCVKRLQAARDGAKR